MDDDFSILEGLRDTLRKEEYDVATASSAAEALEILAKLPVDVVVSDECMPGMSGAELLATVRDSHPNVVRMMLTGEASLKAATRAINGGLYRFLTKPIESQELKQALRSAMKLRQLADERTRLSGL